MRSVLLLAAFCSSIRTAHGADAACSIKDLETSIAAIEKSLSANTEQGKTVRLICANPCKALSQWQKFAAAEPKPPVTEASKVERTLGAACTHSQYLEIADYLLKQRRFSNTLKAFKSGPPGRLPRPARTPPPPILPPPTTPPP